MWAFMPWLNTSLLIYKRGQQYKPYKTGDLQVSLVNIRSFTFKMLNQMIVFSYFQCREGRWGMFFIYFTLKSFFSHNTHLSFALVWPLSWKNLVTPLDRENFISWKDGRNYKIEWNCWKRTITAGWSILRHLHLITHEICTGYMCRCFSFCVRLLSTFRIR